MELMGIKKKLKGLQNSIILNRGQGGKHLGLGGQETNGGTSAVAAAPVRWDVGSV